MRIILALDGSDESHKAADLLARLPLPESSQITVVTVVIDTPMDEIDTEVWMKIREASRVTALQNYQAVLPKLGAFAANAEHLLLEGHPSRVIVDAAKGRDADLIILGARGHSLIARVLLGSTADYVANRARCPVLVVRPQTPKQTSGPLRIILAYDGSAGSEVAAQQLFAFPWGADTQIQITTLLERPRFLPEDEVYDPQAIADGERKLSELVAKAECSANIRYHVRETNHVGDALAHLAEQEQGDLMFVGETGRSALAQFFLGSAARHILHHSASSVWIARGKNWS